MTPAKPKSEQDVKVWLITKQKYTNLVDGPEAFAVYVIDKSRYDEALAEIERLKKIIAKELSENDELGSEYTFVNILKEENQKLREALKSIIDVDSQYNPLLDSTEYWRAAEIARAALDNSSK